MCININGQWSVLGDKLNKKSMISIRFTSDLVQQIIGQGVGAPDSLVDLANNSIEQVLTELMISKRMLADVSVLIRLLKTVICSILL